MKPFGFIVFSCMIWMITSGLSAQTEIEMDEWYEWWQNNGNEWETQYVPY